LLFFFTPTFASNSNPFTHEDERRQVLLPLLDSRRIHNVRTLRAELSIHFGFRQSFVTLASSIDNRYHATLEIHKEHLAAVARMFRD
jgi:hypothetical protein